MEGCQTLDREIRGMEGSVTLIFRKLSESLAALKKAALLTEAKQEQHKDVMHCIACGSEIEKSRYCPHCGILNPQELKCANCGHVDTMPVHLLKGRRVNDPVHCSICGTLHSIGSE